VRRDGARLALLAVLALGVPAMGGCGWEVARGNAPTRQSSIASVPPAGAVARSIELPGRAAEGLDGAALMARGQQRYEIFCVVCHGHDGRGDGAAVRRGFPRPPSFHEARLRERPPAHVVEVITNGIGDMYPFGGRIPPSDRWAIAHHVRALQERVQGSVP
jgi:mono/diheme cytochrome c family protein